VQREFSDTSAGFSMNISFKEIDESNWLECILLTTNKEDKHYIFEEFVASNALSIAQSKIQDDWITKAIYVNEAMVGFTMYGLSSESGYYEICRLMIDYRFQGRGYGKAALYKLIEEMNNVDGCKELYLSFDPNNIIARNLYESFCFKDTGRIVDGELLYCLSLPTRNPAL